LFAALQYQHERELFKVEHFECENVINTRLMAFLFGFSHVYVLVTKNIRNITSSIAPCRTPNPALNASLCWICIVRLQASGMGLFYIRVNVKASTTGSITKWSLHGTSLDTGLLCSRISLVFTAGAGRNLNSPLYSKLNSTIHRTKKGYV
jgi:hypothetical protein